MVAAAYGHERARARAALIKFAQVFLSAAELPRERLESSVSVFVSFAPASGWSLSGLQCSASRLRLLMLLVARSDFDHDG